MISFHQPAKNDALHLLDAANLPTADLTEAHLNYFWALADQQQPIGIIGLEPFAPYGLLRSLVVSPSRRNQGVGTRLVQHAEIMARHMRIVELYLLTSTAQEFFENFDYRPVRRNSAPEAIKHTREFCSLCPASSTLMKKDLVKKQIDNATQRHR
jgi:amino-acid N-acetyltransferase